MNKKKDLSHEDKQTWENYIKDPLDIYDKDNNNQKRIRKGRFKFDLHGFTLDEANIKVKEILLEIADSHPHLMKNPTPNVIFKNFGDNSLDFQLIFTYNNGFRVNLIESDIRFLVYKKFKENNINIPYPQRVVHLQK